MADETIQTDDPEASPMITVTQPTDHMLDRMTQSLGLWQTRTEAALFLASLALVNGKGPAMPGDEDEEERSKLATVDELHEAVDEDGQLALLALARDPQADLDTFLEEELAGLMAAGAGILAPRLKGLNASQATAELVTLVEEIS